ncbi:MAG TPA: bifunctional 4-hydroxy-2-oxoglutarate aldolase/2-dehydro-3-deoxy-phosphogluconate aldolase [Candidatus Hydrogenedentes bacterium]|nr:bifunctional 4-hydroxy-2-oxoglutarate aldolase/2-dehydro-3-deoxy-phosphogluconate aldolase [Candidatus Hydrogenedentota bacterium]HPJ98546.1 bifunctional 4-hydroxy-2-oxoglutarate aldolase/2-dehydro-3-deoxy-phosphogluconate aldolase [Candidatus Hydrogenedentota bacterium]
MNKFDAIHYLLKKCIIAVVRADRGGDDLVKVVEAVAAGGVHCIEVTMTTPGALDCLKTASEKLRDADVLLGVGTVLDPETCRMAILAGARYVVTPTLSLPTIQMARRYGRPILCGAYTPTEILTAWENGADFVKVFPAQVGGPGYIKALKGPLPQVPLVPTGGVELENVGAFLSAGAAALAVGGNLVSNKQVLAQDFAGITANARAFADAVNAARGEQ